MKNRRGEESMQSQICRNPLLSLYIPAFVVISNRSLIRTMSCAADGGYRQEDCPEMAENAKVYFTARSSKGGFTY
jgi:hypothetical protein